MREQLEAEYKLFLNSGDKPNYYKSDEEIRSLYLYFKRENA